MVATDGKIGNEINEDNTAANANAGRGTSTSTSTSTSRSVTFATTPLESDFGITASPREHCQQPARAAAADATADDKGGDDGGDAYASNHNLLFPQSTAAAAAAASTVTTAIPTQPPLPRRPDTVFTRPPSRHLGAQNQRKNGKLDVTQFVPTRIIQKFGILPEIPSAASAAADTAAAAVAAAVGLANLGDSSQSGGGAAGSSSRTTATSSGGAAHAAAAEAALMQARAQTQAKQQHTATAGREQAVAVTPFPVVLQEISEDRGAHILADGTTLRAKEEATLAHARKSIMNTGQVSVFLSSPFKGIEEERSLFARRELPRLQRKCEARGVHLRILDLRWGISNKQKDDQELLNICLKEIEHSDFFVGFHATRYECDNSVSPSHLPSSYACDNSVSPSHLPSSVRV